MKKVYISVIISLLSVIFYGYHVYTVDTNKLKGKISVLNEKSVLLSIEKNKLKIDSFLSDDKMKNKLILEIINSVKNKNYNELEILQSRIMGDYPSDQQAAKIDELNKTIYEFNAWKKFFFFFPKYYDDFNLLKNDSIEIFDMKKGSANLTHKSLRKLLKYKDFSDCGLIIIRPVNDWLKYSGESSELKQDGLAYKRANYIKKYIINTGFKGRVLIGSPIDSFNDRGVVINTYLLFLNED